MNIQSTGVMRKGYDEASHKAESPTDADLQAISRLAGGTVTAEEVFCGQMLLCNDQYDRAHERFPKEYLDRFAETLPGKSVMDGHNYDTAPVGRFYAADVVERSGVNHVLARYYLPAASDRARDVRLGIAKGVSIGYHYDVRNCDLCGKSPDKKGSVPPDQACQHNPGHEYDGKTATITYGGDAKKAEAVEGSFVWLPCQYGAESIAASAAFNSAIKAALQAAQHEESPSPQKGACSMTIEEATAEIERLKPLAMAGEEYEKFLRAEIDRKVSALKAMGTPTYVHITESTPLAHLKATSEGLDTQLKAVPAAAGGKAEGADHLPEDKGKQEWVPRKSPLQARQGRAL